MAWQMGRQHCVTCRRPWTTIWMPSILPTQITHSPTPAKHLRAISAWAMAIARKDRATAETKEYQQILTLCPPTGLQTITTASTAT